MTYVEYKQLNPFQRFAYNTKKFFCNIPHAVAHFFTALGKAIVKFFVGIGKGFANYGKTFVKGDWATKLSYLIFGVGDLSKGISLAWQGAPSCRPVQMSSWVRLSPSHVLRRVFSC